jgi:hypothetical protein
MLSPVDESYLHGKGFEFEVTVEQGLICVIVKNYSLPIGYSANNTDLLLRLPPGFPDAQPDMFWCDPAIRITSTGAFPQAADLMENHLGRTWQRFSRHLGEGVWLPGTDNLGSYMALIYSELERSLKGPA